MPFVKYAYKQACLFSSMLVKYACSQEYCIPYYLNATILQNHVYLLPQSGIPRTTVNYT